MKKTSIFTVFFLLCGFYAFANPQNSDFRTAEEILAMAQNESKTECASKIFLDALIEHGDEVSEIDEENVVQAWAKTTMMNPKVLIQVLKCPEIQYLEDTDTIVFTPFVYKFSNGRMLNINYSTKPKVLKQHLMLATKRSLPNIEHNPDLLDPYNDSVYINTEPAWYAIMVVQHNSLSEFVGPDKNNTISLQYISDHIDSIYPHGYFCTSKSAIANDNDTINQVVHEIVDLEDDSNDYYVAGDVDLGWIMYAEIAAEVILTVATLGTGEAGLIALKGVRATKNASKLVKSIHSLKKLENVQKYAEVATKISAHTDDIVKLEKNIKNAKKYEKALKNIEDARKVGKDVTKYEKEAQQIFEQAKEIDPKITKDLLKDSEKLTENRKQLQESVKTLEKNANEMVKQDDNVKLYKEQVESFHEVWQYRHDLQAFRRPQTGNVVTRNLKKIGAYLKTVKAANNGADTMTKAGKLVRAGMSSRSAKISDWLFDATLKHGARLARFERDVGLAYGAITFLGDMYDYTSSTSKEFSNGIEFKPLCLLSADDLEGQDNVVNYGMWLMWVGNSTNPADDDAAYLQAMDFATKFYYQLNSFQDDNGANCNVDIYVVRPIIRLEDKEKTNGEMFYLFMNDIPWTTATQFGNMVSDIDDWERIQIDLDKQDPNNKYHRKDNDLQERVDASENVPESVVVAE